MKDHKWILYGATGYTGRLIIEQIASQNFQPAPILAGRNPSLLKELAEAYNLEYRAFSLDSLDAICQNIKDADLVLHCAGPFVQTSEPMAEACIATKTHYLDITGEIPVYELLYSKDAKAKEHSVLLLPGVGFDIVPTDCVAAQLKRWLPDASELHLGFIGLGGGISSGTAKSALAQLPYGSKIRRNGKLLSVPQFHLSREFQIFGKKRTLYSIPWGDVFTAYFSTGIPDITVYTFIPEDWVRISRLATPILPLLRNKLILNLAQGAAELFLKGPDNESRQKGKSVIVGYAKNVYGKEVEIEIQTAEGYLFTAMSALLSVQKVLQKVQAGDQTVGFSTPSLVFGADFVYEIPGTKSPN